MLQEAGGTLTLSDVTVEELIATQMIREYRDYRKRSAQQQSSPNHFG